MPFISLTFWVLMLSKFICFNDEHPANIYFISKTFWVSILSSFNDVRNRQSEKI